MHASTLVLGLLLIYGSQDVLAFDSMTFSSVTQCGPFNVSFLGGTAPSAIPLTLTIIPFNSTNPVSITVAPNAWDAKTSTGAAVTFLPFTAETIFVASLDDANGVGIGPVSDVIKVQPSGNSSCLPSGGNMTTSTAPYTLNGTLSQCLPFNVSFDPTTENAPTVRAFSPKGPSFFVNSTSQSSGQVTFAMNATRGEEIVLLLDDGQNHRQTTNLMTVGGDSSSNMGCIQMSNASTDMQSTTTTKQGLSKGTLIGIVTGSVAVVGFVFTMMVFFIYGERRKRLGKVRKFSNLESQGDVGGEENGEVPQMIANLPSSPVSRPTASVATSAARRPTPTPSSSRFARGITPSESAGVGSPAALSPEFIDYRDRGDELSPWTQPGSPRRLVRVRPSLVLMPLPGSLEDHRELSTTPRTPLDQPELDIDQILDMATMYSITPSPETSIQPFTPATISSHDHYNAPTDVPVGAERMSVFYPSELYPTSQAQSPDGRGQQSVTGDTQESGPSPTIYQIPPIEIATATRLAAAVARVARVDS